LSYDINSLDVSGRLAKDAIFREHDGKTPSTEIILVNSRSIGTKDQEGKRRSTITTIRCMFWGAKARRAANLKKGDEVICYNGCLQDDNVAIDDDGGRTVGRLRVENVQRFIVVPRKNRETKVEEVMSFEEKMLAGEEEPLTGFGEPDED